MHDQAELDAAVDAGAEILGITNRDLHTFETSLSVTERLAGRVPRGKIIVSESGIFTAAHVSPLQGWRQRRAGGGGAGHRR